VGRPSVDVEQEDAWSNRWFWAMDMQNNGFVHHSAPSASAAISATERYSSWPGMESVEQGDTMRLLLDSDAGTLTIKKNGRLLGTPFTSGLTGDLCWGVCCYDSGYSFRIKAVDPEDF
jgi:hypothetical protein